MNNSDNHIHINDDLFIAGEEISFTASRAGGPGGQHVNKVSTKMTLWFDVVNSPSLSDDQRHLILERLATRINKSGVLRVVSRRSRSQQANREAAQERFVLLMREALKQQTPRKKKGISRAAHQRRLDEKKHRSRIKKDRSRGGVGWD